MSLSSLQALVGERARRVTLRGCIPRFIHEQQRVERFGRLLLIRRISGLCHACSDSCIGLVQNWPKHNILRLGIRRSFNLHIVSKAGTMTSAINATSATSFATRPWIFQGQGDTPRQGQHGDAPILYPATENFEVAPTAWLTI
jgi:hypothetical protein